jgi:hypothetical protein
MGWTWEVQAWGMHDGEQFSYQQMWHGESFIRALIAMRRCKKIGYGCVTLYWR